MERLLTTNPRVLHEVFAQYSSTFVAFCELINNSLHARAKNIFIEIDQVPRNELSPEVIRKIVVRDDGHGIPISQLPNTFFRVGTEIKNGGQGIGRFAAFQIGGRIDIETVGYDRAEDKFSKTAFSLTESDLKSKTDIRDLTVNSAEEYLDGLHNTYYQVSITDIYDPERTRVEKKRKLHDNLLIENIKGALFARYPVKIFNQTVTFWINSEVLDPREFVVGEPEVKYPVFKNLADEEIACTLTFFKLKSTENKISVFLTSENAGLKSVSGGFEYNANWLSPKIGTWFVYCDSNALTTDFLRQFDLDELSEDYKAFRSFLKNELNAFFREKNREFDEFTAKLHNDEHYPYDSNEDVPKSKIITFDKIAYLMEDKYHILNEGNTLREIIYPLLDKSISSGSFRSILSKVLKLDAETLERFNSLLEKSELEDIILFSEKVAKNLQDLEFLGSIVNGQVSAHIKERSQLHKVLEKMLWVFGEQFSNATNLLSDKNLENNLRELRDKILPFRQNRDKENVAEITDRKLKSITDLFLFSERILDEDTKEVLIVELKAPIVRLSQDEYGQVQKYAQEIEERGVFPKNLSYKIILVGSEMTKPFRQFVKGATKRNNHPYLVWENEGRNIQIWVVLWSDLIELNQRRLTFLANKLKTKDIDVKEKFESDFAEIDVSKISSRLTKSRSLVGV